MTEVADLTGQVSEGTISSLVEDLHNQMLSDSTTPSKYSDISSTKTLFSRIITTRSLDHRHHHHRRRGRLERILSKAIPSFEIRFVLPSKTTPSSAIDLEDRTISRMTLSFTIPSVRISLRDFPIWVRLRSVHQTASDRRHR